LQDIKLFQQEDNQKEDETITMLAPVKLNGKGNRNEINAK